MSITIDDHRAALIGRILLAASQEEVKLFSDEAIQSLEQHKVNGHIIARFIDKMIADLEQFSPMNKNPEQWSNIKMARVYFKQVKRKSALAVADVK